MKIKQMKTWMIKLMPDVIGITLCPFGIYSKGTLTPTDERHERIHWRQQLELLVIPFYIWYGLEYVIKLIKYRGEAYYNISFEREAYANEGDVTYLSNRRLYSWFKYL
jgi:hypothetical protein